MASKWVSADDKQPKVGSSILANIGDGRLLVLRVTKHEWSSVPGGWDYRNKVTHWMPLPKQPS